jgi:hypothetical protein
VKIDQFVEGFTIALACSRDEIQRVLPRARRSRRPTGANRSVDLADGGGLDRACRIGATAQMLLT